MHTFPQLILQTLTIIIIMGFKFLLITEDVIVGPLSHRNVLLNPYNNIIKAWQQPSVAWFGSTCVCLFMFFPIQIVSTHIHNAVFYPKTFTNAIIILELTCRFVFIQNKVPLKNPFNQTVKCQA
jgi:hypothetical protein